MKKIELLVLVCLLMSVIFVACVTSQFERNAKPTKIDDEVFANQITEPFIPTNTLTLNNKQTTTPAITPESTAISITGMITNMDEVAPYLTTNSYIQLVPHPSNGELIIGIEKGGILEIVSDMGTPKHPIPSDGVINIQVNSLKPGVYIIVVQQIKSPDGWLHVVAIVEESGDADSFKAIEIEIHRNDSLPFIYDMGEVEIQMLDTPFPPIGSSQPTSTLLPSSTTIIGQISAYDEEPKTVLVVPCLMLEEYVCQVQSEMVVQVSDHGSFEIKGVAPGTYAFLYGPESAESTRFLWEDRTIQLGSAESFAESFAPDTEPKLTCRSFWSESEPDEDTGLYKGGVIDTVWVDLVSLQIDVPGGFEWQQGAMTWTGGGAPIQVEVEEGKTVYVTLKGLGWCGD